ncbi:Serpin I2 [Thelohanellus kitauei]|uniref:Serpin I2 n=1 Tax=Thelohanellus kitauei TaxID=669202 RepID=A0A0C2N378_THEKT|nr:Serpin I2 [Thelohanellus kitauei]
MSAEVVNRFSSSVLQQLYVSQKGSGCVSLSGIGLYVMMGALNIGLRGRSFDQLSQFLREDFSELFVNDTWRDSTTAKKWSDLYLASQYPSNMKSAMFYPDDINPYYEQISKSIFELGLVQINLSNSAETAQKINRWITRNIDDGMVWNMIEESILRENTLNFISTISIQTDWKNKFDSAYTDQEIFFDDKNQYFEVEMMNQISNYHIYDSTSNNFAILFKPFTTPELYSVIILPRYSSNVDQVLNEIKFDQMHIYFEKAELKYAKLQLPKFKIRNPHDFSQVLINMGITDIFDRNVSDFGRITNRTIAMGILMQVVNVAIDENGDDSPNVEDLQIQSSEYEEEFLVTRPFLFLIYSNNLVHFSTVVTNPNFC